MLLGNDHYHGNSMTADMSGTLWHETTQVLSKSVHWKVSYSISNTLQYGGRPPSYVLKILTFRHAVVTDFQICCYAPNFDDDPQF